MQCWAMFYASCPILVTQINIRQKTAQHVSRDLMYVATGSDRMTQVNYFFPGEVPESSCTQYLENTLSVGSVK